MEKELVTLLLPFYNAEKYIGNALNSIKGQTYKKIEVILIDDGSTDKSYEICRKYITDGNFNKFERVKLLRKENGGAASAINMALKYVSGEFLSWMDSDDELLPNNILKKVKFLMKNTDYDLVCVGAVEYNYENNEKIKNLIIKKEEQDINIFERLINGVPCYSGVFMIRTNKLFGKLKNRNIAYNKEVGQNWQLLLPVAYSGKCGYINEILYKYYIRSDSHSHNVDYKKEIYRTLCQEKILKETLEFVEEKKRKKILNRISRKMQKERFNLAFANLDREECNKYFYFSLKNVIKIIIINSNFFTKKYKKLKEKKL